MKWAVEMGSGGMKNVPSSTEIDSGIQKLLRGIYTQKKKTPTNSNTEYKVI
jgi:hypothetical protein